MIIPCMYSTDLYRPSGIIGMIHTNFLPSSIDGGAFSPARPAHTVR